MSIKSRRIAYLVSSFIVVALLIRSSSMNLRTINPAPDFSTTSNKLSVISTEYQLNNGTARGDFAPGLEGHLQPFEVSTINTSEDFLPFNHYFQEHTIGTDTGSHAVVVRQTEFESQGRGDLDFKLDLIYSSLEQYRRSNLETFATYLHPYYEHWRNELNDPYTYYFDAAYEDLFNGFLQSAEKQLGVWQLGESVCTDPPWLSIDDVNGWNPCGPNELCECYLDQFGQTLMPTNEATPKEKVQILLDRMGDVLTYMRQWNYYYDEACFDPVTFEEDSNSSLCINPMKLLQVQLQLQFDELNRFTTQAQKDFAALADATSTPVFPAWWSDNLGYGWTFNLPFIELPGNNYGTDFDQPGAIYFEGYRRRVIGNQGRTIGKFGYVEFPDEQAIYWNLTAFRQRFNSGPGHYTPCDWIGDPWSIAFDYSCSPVPGLESGPLPFIAGEFQLELKHLVMQRDRLYWFNEYGQLRFITDHTLKNYIEVSWKYESNNALETSRIAYIKDAAGNIYRFYYKDEVTFSSLPLLDHPL